MCFPVRTGDFCIISFSPVCASLSVRVIFTLFLSRPYVLPCPYGWFLHYFFLARIFIPVCTGDFYIISFSPVCTSLSVRAIFALFLFRPYLHPCLYGWFLHYCFFARMCTTVCTGDFCIIAFSPDIDINLYRWFLIFHLYATHHHQVLLYWCSHSPCLINSLNASSIH